MYKPCLKTLHFVGAKKWEKPPILEKTLFVCLNAVVYKTYLNESNVACRQSFVDPNAHRMSIERSMKMSMDILNKLSIGDIHKILVNTLESINIFSPPPPVASSTFNMTLTTWKAELKALDDKIYRK